MDGYIISGYKKQQSEFGLDHSAGAFSSVQTAEWYALHTRCRHEKRAAVELRDKGIQTFLPTYKERHRWSDRHKVIEAPLFSCYVFVHLLATPTARIAALQVPGVLRFVGFNGTPASIPPAQINNIQTILQNSEGYSPFEFMCLGQRVRIRGGALDGVEGVLVGRKSDCRLVVSIDLIQQAIAVVIDGYDVEPV